MNDITLEKIIKECDSILEWYISRKNGERALDQLYGFLHGCGSLNLLDNWYELYKKYEKKIK